MQEYPLRIIESLKHGELPNADWFGAGQYVTTARYIRPTEAGLRAPRAVTDPMTPSQTVSATTWPFPQMIRGNAVTLLATAADIYNVSDWTVGDAILQLGTSITGQYHLVDNYNMWLLVNPDRTVYKSRRLHLLGETDTVEYNTDISIQTGCMFKGRSMLGGFDPDTYWSEDWKSIFDSFRMDFTRDLVDLDAPGTNFVSWSTIGGGDLLDLFDANIAVTTPFGDDEAMNLQTSMLMEKWKRNEAGIAPMPFNGTVLRMAPLGEGVIVYGDNGIAVMRPVTNVFPTFSIKQIAEFGILGRDAVGVSLNGHLFVASSGELYTIDTDFNIKILGYEAYLSPILDSSVVVTYDAQNKGFYISGELNSELYSWYYDSNGLHRTPYSVTSGVFADGAFVGLRNLNSSTETMLITDSFDMGYRDIKTISGIELGGHISTDATSYVAIEYKTTSGSAFTRTNWCKVSPRGYAGIICSGVEFRVAVKCTLYEDFSLDYINVKWQSSGHVTMRGPNADQANL